MAAAAIAPCAVRGAAAQARIDSLITAHMERYHLPGLAAAAVDSGRIVWIGTYGWGDVARRKPITEHTPFSIASVSKPFTATTLLSLQVAGRFDLDADINGYLPFRVRNPNHPLVPITFRQLLRHRSSVADNSSYYQPFWSQANGDPTLALADYLGDYLPVGGANYDSANNYLMTAPDAARRYCNTCYALLGYLAEHISGEPYERLAQETLFDPLGMTETAWFLRDLRAPDAAIPHRFAQDTGYIAYGHIGYPDWPAGQLRASIRDLARFLSVYAAGGNVNGRSLIDGRVIDLMAPRDADVGFHTWQQIALRNREILYFHAGGDIGVSSAMGFRRNGGRGVVVVANGAGPLMPIFEEIYLAIGKELNGAR